MRTCARCGRRGFRGFKQVFLNGSRRWCKDEVACKQRRVQVHARK